MRTYVWVDVGAKRSARIATRAVVAVVVLGKGEEGNVKGRCSGCEAEEDEGLHFATSGMWELGMKVLYAGC